jgi:hypothetical protein
MRIKIGKLLLTRTHFLFLVIGSLAFAINLIFFSIFNTFLPAYLSSFFCFFVAVTFNFFMHGIFLWKVPPSFNKFYLFISGYSIGLLLNVLFIYFFVSFFSSALYAQVIGGSLGVVFNFFSSKFSYTGKIAGKIKD